jgi:ankyrin repeat protein
METVKLLLDLGANVHAQTEEGMITPLHHAAACGRVET